MSFSTDFTDLLNYSYDEVEMNEDDPDNNEDSLLGLPLRNTTTKPRPPQLVF
jgi:hypothetical protein